MVTTLRVAAIQATSLNGQMERNLANAERLVRDAVERGAELVLCPELLAAGYVYDESLWDSAETHDGPTETWLARLARERGILVGASYLEAAGEEFFNTFALFGPAGLLGRVRKGSLPFFEGWFFTCSSGSRSIETEHGTVSVGICNDNQTADFLRHVKAARPVLILMPHSAPTPHARLLGPVWRSLYERQLQSIAQRYARAFGTPVVMANKVSALPTPTPIPLLPLWTVQLDFHGLSSICDADGRQLAASRGEELALVADVALDPARRRTPISSGSGYWSFAPPLVGSASGALMRTLDALGRRAYRKNPRRRRAAAAHARRAP